MAKVSSAHQVSSGDEDSGDSRTYSESGQSSDSKDGGNVGNSSQKRAASTDPNSRFLAMTSRSDGFASGNRAPDGLLRKLVEAQMFIEQVTAHPPYLCRAP